MKNCIFNKMFWNVKGWNIEIGINITRWLIGFGWTDGGNFVHVNFGPIVMSFIRSVD